MQGFRSDFQIDDQNTKRDEHHELTAVKINT